MAWNDPWKRRPLLVASHLCYHMQRDYLGIKKTQIIYEPVSAFSHFRTLNHIIDISVSSVQFSRSVVCDSLWPHGLQNARLPVHHQLPELAQTHVHQVSDAISSSVCPFPPAFNLSQHQGLLQRVSASYHVAKVLELQLQHQPFQWIFRVDFFLGIYMCIYT